MDYVKIAFVAYFVLLAVTIVVHVHTRYIVNRNRLATLGGILRYAKLFNAVRCSYTVLIVVGAAYALYIFSILAEAAATY